MQNDRYSAKSISLSVVRLLPTRHFDAGIKAALRFIVALSNPERYTSCVVGKGSINLSATNAGKRHQL